MSRPPHTLIPTIARLAEGSRRGADPGFLEHMREITRKPKPRVLPIKEAPYEVTRLFSAWLADGRPSHLGNALRDLLQPFRGTWLLTPDWAVRLVKVNDRQDSVLVFEPRKSPIRRARPVAIPEPADSPYYVPSAPPETTEEHV